MKQRKRYTAEFKREVLQMAASGEGSIPELERDLGITSGMIYKWRDRYQLDESDGGLRPSDEQEAAAELRRVKRELEIVRQERDILKKAIEIFSKEQR
jgi:transposase